MNNDVMRVVPQELNSGTKLGRFLYFSDVAFIVIYFLMLSYLEDLVIERIRLYFYTLNIIVAVTLCMPSWLNRRRKMWQTLIFALTKDNQVYKNPQRDTVSFPQMDDEELYSLYLRWENALRKDK